MNTTNVLVLGGTDRVTVAIARTLGRTGGYSVHLATAHGGRRLNRMRQMLHSRFIKSVSYIRGHYTDPSFLDQLRELANRYAIDVIMPTDDRTALILSAHKPELGRTCAVAVEDHEKIVLFHDKERTMRLASELGIDQPRTVVPWNEKEVRGYAERATYPVVIKARRGQGADGIWYARNAGELVDLYRHVTRPENAGDGLTQDRTFPLLQEYVPGELHDAILFCREGRILTAATQHRALTLPLSGGCGCIDIATNEPELIERAGLIAAQTRWNGVMCLDFVMDSRDGIPKFLEVNPRLGGCLWLMICAGLNIPHYMAQQALGRPVEVSASYTVGLMARWLLMEIKSISEKPVTSGEKLRRCGAFFKRFGYRPQVSDIQLSDIRPVLARLALPFCRGR